MKAKHRATLKTLFARPTPGGVVFADIEALVVAMGGQIREGDGSRVAFECNGLRIYMHRPHPGKEARKYQVEQLRQWFIDQGVNP